MNILALDTASPAAALALARGDGAEFAAVTDPATRHGRGLIPALAGLLRQAGLHADSIDAVAVGLGPGSFTGLRIGLAAAKTLAYARACPLAGLDSLEVLAWGAPADALHLAVVADAQRGDVFAADFARQRPGSRPDRAAPTRLEPLTTWLAALPHDALVIAAEPLRARHPWPPHLRLAPPEASRPSGPALLALARSALAAGRRDDPWTLEPAYFRRSAAEEKAASRPR